MSLFGAIGGALGTALIPIPGVGTAVGAALGSAVGNRIGGGGGSRTNARGISAELEAEQLGLARQLRDPRDSFGYFQRLAAGLAPSRSSMMETAALSGGSRIAAGVQSRQMQARAGDAALGAFGQYRRQALGLSADVLSGVQQQRLGAFGVDATRSDNRRAQNLSLFGDLLGAGASLAGTIYGNQG